MARQFNSKVRLHNLPFYQLIAVMHSVATMIEIQAQLMVDDKIRRNQLMSDPGRIATA